MGDRVHDRSVGVHDCGLILDLKRFSLRGVREKQVGLSLELNFQWVLTGHGNT